MVDFPQLSRERAASNNPYAWDKLADLLERYAHILTGSILPANKTIAAAGAEATGVLYCMILEAKKGEIDLAFYAAVNASAGSNFGQRMLTWATNLVAPVIKEDEKILWDHIRTSMAHSLEMIASDFKPVGQEVTPELVTAWVNANGGIAKLNMAYISKRRSETAKEKQSVADKAKAWDDLQKLNAAQEAGFDTVEAHAKHLAVEAEAKRIAALQARFGELKARLAKNGTVTDKPADGKLVIVQGGLFYVLSDEDEVALLQCAASVMPPPGK